MSDLDIRDVLARRVEGFDVPIQQQREALRAAQEAQLAEPSKMSAEEQLGQVLQTALPVALAAVFGGKRAAGLAAPVVSKDIDRSRAERALEHQRGVARAGLQAEAAQSSLDDLLKQKAALEGKILDLEIAPAKAAAVAEATLPFKERISAAGATRVQVDTGEKIAKQLAPKVVEGQAQLTSLVKGIDSAINKLEDFKDQGRIEFQLKGLTKATEVGKLKAQLVNIASQMIKLEQGARPSDFDFQKALERIQGDNTVNAADVQDLLMNARQFTTQVAQDRVNLLKTVSETGTMSELATKLQEELDTAVGSAASNLSTDEQSELERLRAKFGKR